VVVFLIVLALMAVRVGDLLWGLGRLLFPIVIVVMMIERTSATTEGEA